jgi:hypothetical protein
MKHAAGEVSRLEPLVHFEEQRNMNVRGFVSVSTSDFSQTTLLDVSGDEAIEGVSFPGFMGNVVRVR